MKRICHICEEPIRLFDVYTILVPDGEGFQRVDGRARTPTGGKFGVGGGKFRRFTKTKKVPAHGGCALHFTVVDWPGKLRFEDRCKAGRR